MCGQDMEKLELFCIMGGTVNDTAAEENSMAAKSSKN